MMLVKLIPNIGITERGDPSLDFSWVNKLCLYGNIIITKNLSDVMIDILLKYKTLIILHMTVTGMGGSDIEPNVPTPDFNFNQLKKLIDRGFPVKQIVLRIDPIIPDCIYINKYVEPILSTFIPLGITRVRYSYMDFYLHVKVRFIKASINIPMKNMNEMSTEETMTIMESFNNITAPYRKLGISFESCGEVCNCVGCISKKDLEILGHKNMRLNTRGLQRTLCLCSSSKTELLKKGHRCSHQCLYCYWKDKS